MFCSQCGHENPDHANFCKACGKNVDRAKPILSKLVALNPTTSFSKRTVRGTVVFFGLLCAIAVIAQLVNNREIQKEMQTTPEIDVKTVAFAKKEIVEKIFGLPTRYEICCRSDNEPKFDIAHYEWGDVTFDPNGKAADVWYRFIRHPHSLEAALKRVGLDKTSEPIQFASMYRWCPTCTPASPALFNGDLKFNVTVITDRKDDGFEAIHVDFDQWTGRELLNKPTH